MSNGLIWYTKTPSDDRFDFDPATPLFKATNPADVTDYAEFRYGWSMYPEGNS